MAGGGRCNLTASMLIGSGAYSDDDDDDDLDGVAEAARSFTIEDDEEAEVLIYDAESQAEALAQAIVKRAFSEHQQQNGTVLEPSVEDLSMLIAHDMQRLNIGVPKLETTLMSIVVQFWADGADTPLAFLLETDEMYVPREAMAKFCTQLCEAPFRARMPIINTEEEDEVEEEASASVDEDEAEDTSGVVVDDVPERWIPEHGRVNVLAVMYAQAPVIIGLLTEVYNVNHNQRLNGIDDGGDVQDDFNLDRLNMNGKRIQWLDGAAGTKRSRMEDVEGASSAKESDTQNDSPMVIGMHGFASAGNNEWTSAINRDALVCAFERDDVTGQLKEVRVALALHALGLRHALQQMLQDTRNNL